MLNVDEDVTISIREHYDKIAIEVCQAHRFGIIVIDD